MWFKAFGVLFILRFGPIYFFLSSQKIFLTFPRFPAIEKPVCPAVHRCMLLSEAELQASHLSTASPSTSLPVRTPK